MAARLDQLDPAERAVLEWGAIEGELFHRGAVQALAPPETEATPRRADGTPPMTAELFGDVNNPIPRPTTARLPAT